MDSPSSSFPMFVARQDFNAFHKIDRALFSRLVLSLSRDINQSLHVMSFLLYLESSGFVSHLIAYLGSLPDYFINGVADEVSICLTCLSYDDFSTFIANLGQSINGVAIPLVSRMTGEQLSLEIIHQHRKDILEEMSKNLTRVCKPAFQDICVHAEMYNKEKMYAEEKGKAIEKMNQLEISSMVHRAESSSQFLSEQPETSNVARGGAAAISEDEQVMADERTVFLTFSRGYPISEAEVHGYFTRRFGEIIEAIYMPAAEGGQALYAKMVLRSAAKIPEIVSDRFNRNKFTINGKHVWARKYVPKYSTNNHSPSY